MPSVDMPIEKLKEYKGINPRPTNFNEYWDNALNEMKAVDPKVELIKSDFQVDFAECYDLYFTGVRGARIYAKYLRPKNIKNPHPAILKYHGYMSSSPDWTVVLPYVAMGFSVFAMDCRGQGGKSEDTGGVKGNTLRGHIIRGLGESAENLLFRHVFLDAVELANIAFKMDEVDENRVGVIGGSQGGALALVCGALEPKIRRLAVKYPFLCDYKRVWDMDLGETAYEELRDYFRRFDPLHQREEEVFTKLGYIDVQNFVERIKGEVLMMTGLMDETCPASTQFAAYNKINSKKEMLIYPDYGHETNIPGTEDITLQYMMGLLNLE